MNSTSTEPPMLFLDFLRAIGVTDVTGWRWRQNGLVSTFNINGRQYIAREEVAKFNARAAAGEFARTSSVRANRRAAKEARDNRAARKPRL